MSKSINMYTIKDPLMEPYYIQYDQACYTVVKTVTSGKGRDRESLVGHYSSVNACLNSIAEDSIKNQDYESIASFIDAHANKLKTLKQLENYEITSTL
jgi:hypothetical protein